ncbi:succinate dehydrogenase, cytochrome b556 subunit [Micavibrio aeruginosavorus]|uniref:succinate dehydrogenase, cytochrome b556 subunit n=1 Tax=Micavibrio aeruginosavorus TaxID=349221 RepID=UPI003F4AE1D8
MQPTTPTKRPRPLSPHIQVYRWEITMALSILHRMSGMALAIGAFVLVWMLVAAAIGPEAYAFFARAAAHPVGTLFLVGWTFALIFHGLNGLRHLFWDMGRGFEIKTAKDSGWLVLVGALAATAALWWSICPWSDVDSMLIALKQF